MAFLLLHNYTDFINPLLLECLKDIEGSLQAELKKDYQSDPAELEV